MSTSVAGDPDVFAPITVPPFYCPIAAPSTPDAGVIGAGTRAWLDRTGADLGDTRRGYLAGTDIGRSASLTIPVGPTGRRQLYGDLLFWLYAFDDSVADETDDEDRDVTGLLLALTRQLERPAAAAHDGQPWLVTAMSELFDRLARCASEAQTRSCARYLREYVLNVALSMTRRRAGGAPPSLNDYVISRLGESAVQVVTAMIPIVGGYELSAADLADRRVTALVEMVNFLTSWDNDLVGHNKETFRSARYGYPAVPDALTILAAEHDCTVAEAVRLAVAYRDRVMCRFLRLRYEVVTTAAAPLTDYVNGLGYWVRGYLEWALRTERFQDPRNPGDSMEITRFSVPTTWATSALDDRDTPLPIPTVAWWWSV